MYLRGVSLWNSDPDRLRDVLAVPRQRDLLPLRLVAHLLERLAPDEVVVELHERPVAEVVRRRGSSRRCRRSSSCRRASRCPRSLRRQPLAVRLHLVAGEHRRERGRDPARLERVRRVDARADLLEPEVLPGLEDRGTDVLALRPRPPDLQSGHARHAVVERPHLAAAMVISPMLKNLISGSEPPFAFSRTSTRSGPGPGTARTRARPSGSPRCARPSTRTS